MTALIIIACILGVVAFLLLFPITFCAELGEKPQAEIKWLFLKFKFPTDERKSKKKKKNAESQKPKAAAKKQKKKKRQPIYKQISEYGDVAKELFKALGKLIKFINFKSLAVNIKLCGTDAAETALEYGAVCAVIYPLLGALDSAVNIKNKQVNITADYRETESRGDVYIKLSLLPVLGIIAAAKLAISILKITGNGKER